MDSSNFLLTWTVLRSTPLMISGFCARMSMVGSSCANNWNGTGLRCISRKDLRKWSGSRRRLLPTVARARTPPISVETVCGDLCLVVRIGKVDERLEYLTLVQLKRQWKIVDENTVECQGRNLVPQEMYVWAIFCEERDEQKLT